MGATTALDLLQMTPLAYATRNLVIAVLKSEPIQQNVNSHQRKAYNCLLAATIVRLLHDGRVKIV